MTQTPAPIRTFAIAITGSIQIAADRSWPRNNSSIRVLTSTADHRYFLKQHPQPTSTSAR